VNLVRFLSIFAYYAEGIFGVPVRCLCSGRPS
jgi:hypothetical protein